MSKSDKINQRINNGNENIQIGGDVNAENLNINLFKDPFAPKAIIFYEEHLVEVIEVFDKEYGKKMDIYSDEYEKKIEELKKFKDTKKDKKNKKIDCLRFILELYVIDIYTILIKLIFSSHLQ